MVYLSKIRDLCDARGISLKQLAHSLDLSERTIHLMLSQNTTKISTLEQIADYFNVDITYFFTSKEEETRKFTDGVFASLEFITIYDIWKLFRGQEESFLIKSEALIGYLTKHENKLVANNYREDIFSHNFSNDLIIRFYNSLIDFDKETLNEIKELLIVLLGDFYEELRKPDTFRYFIDHGFIKSQNVETILQTYFVEFSIIGKFLRVVLNKEIKF